MVSESRSVKKLRSIRYIEKYKEPLRGTTVFKIEIRKDISTRLLKHSSSLRILS